MTEGTYTTRLSEDEVLSYFHTMAREPDVDRLALLQQLATVRLERPSDWDFWAVRQAMAGVRITLTGERCFACRTEARKIYWHHVVQVQHGGSNSPHNLQPLCHRCHRTVHPWLPEPTTLENRHGWSHIGDFAVRAMDKLVAMWEGREPRIIKRRKRAKDEE
jgi:hypothetical protein